MTPTVAAIVINRNNWEQTALILKAVSRFKKIPICVALIDWDCVTRENSASKLVEWPMVNEYDLCPETETLFEAYNLAISKLLNRPGIAKIWLVGNEAPQTGPEADELIPLKLFESTGVFDPRYRSDVGIIDWLYRSKSNYKLTIQPVPSVLANYFEGRDPWLFIRRQLKRQWWTGPGLKAMTFWAKKAIGAMRTNHHQRKQFWLGTVDGLKLLLG